jgi:hypothetical protein
MSGTTTSPRHHSSLSARHLTDDNSLVAMTIPRSEKEGLDQSQLDQILRRYPGVCQSEGPLSWNAEDPQRFGTCANAIGAPEGRFEQCFATRPLGQSYYAFTMADGSIVPVSTQHLRDSLADPPQCDLSSTLCSTSGLTGRLEILAGIAREEAFEGPSLSPPPPWAKKESPGTHGTTTFTVTYKHPIRPRRKSVPFGTLDPRWL